jgi:hypothetical protein
VRAVAADAPSRRPRLQPLQGVSESAGRCRAGHGYFDMAGFALGVEDELGVMTQVATPRGLKLRIRHRVLREAVAL